MFKIKKGNSRTVLLTQWYVVKFPRLKFLWAVLKTIIKLGFTFQWNLISRRTRHDWHWFLRHFNANRTEAWCWKETKASFLVPTYSILGFINIQKFEKGIEPTRQDLYSNVLLPASTASGNYLHCVDPHCFETKNFIKNEKGYRMVDYGDTVENGMTISKYLRLYHKEIERFFVQK